MTRGFSGKGGSQTSHAITGHVSVVRILALDAVFGVNLAILRI